LGYILSPTIGGLMASTIGKQKVFLIAFIFYALSILPLLLIHKQRRTESKVSPDHFSANDGHGFRTKLILLSCFFIIIMFFLYLLYPLIPQFTNGVYHQSIFRLGVFGTATSAGWATFSIILGKLGDKYSKMTAVVTSLLVSSLSFLLIILFNNFAILFVASFLVGASYTIWFFMPGIIASNSPERSVGKWVSISQASVAMVGFGAPILGGILFETSPYFPFFLTIIILALLAIVAFRLTKKPVDKKHDLASSWEKKNLHSKRSPATLD
jgi:MFS family permease